LRAAKSAMTGTLICFLVGVSGVIVGEVGNDTVVILSRAKDLIMSTPQ
jgi:hypothetical protein